MAAGGAVSQAYDAYKKEVTKEASGASEEQVERAARAFRLELNKGFPPGAVSMESVANCLKNEVRPPVGYCYAQ